MGAPHSLFAHEVGVYIKRKPNFHDDKVSYCIDHFTQLELRECSETGNLVFTAVVCGVVVGKSVADNLHTTIKMALADVLEKISQFFAYHKKNVDYISENLNSK